MNITFKSVEVEVDDTWRNFFSEQAGNLKRIESEIGSSFTPADPIDIFKIFRLPQDEIDIVLFGQDPYPQRGHATGRCFERELDSWYNLSNPSLEAILVSIYAHEQNRFIDYKSVCTEISLGNWNIDPPNVLFKNWEKNKGVFLPNIAFTTNTSEKLAHRSIWEPFIDGLITELNKLPNLKWILWGDVARAKRSIINSNDNVYEASHPAKHYYQEPDASKMAELNAFAVDSSIEEILDHQKKDSLISREYKRKIKELIREHPKDFNTFFSRFYPFSFSQIELFIDKVDKSSLFYHNNKIHWNLNDLVQLTNVPWAFTEGIWRHANFGWRSEDLIKYGDKIDWGIEGMSRCTSITWTDEILETFENELDWERMSMNTGLDWTYALLEKYKTKWNWKEISRNRSVCWDKEMISKYSDLLSWHELSANTGVPWDEELIAAFQDKVNWRSLSGNPNVDWTTRLLSRFTDKLNWYTLSSNKGLTWTEELINQFFEKWNHSGLVSNSAISMSHALVEKLRQHVDDVSLMWSGRIPWTETELLENAHRDNLWVNKIPVSSRFLRENKNSIHWEKLSYNKHMPWTLEFISSFENEWNWMQLSMNKNLPWSFDLLWKFREKWWFRMIDRHEGIYADISKTLSETEIFELVKFTFDHLDGEE